MRKQYDNIQPKFNVATGESHNANDDVENKRKRKMLPAVETILKRRRSVAFPEHYLGRNSCDKNASYRCQIIGFFIHFSSGANFKGGDETPKNDFSQTATHRM